MSDRQRKVSNMQAEANRDLGFGSVVTNESRQRFLNRDGSFNVARKGLKFWSSLSLYQSLLTMPWWEFLAFVIIAYLGLNILFASAFLLCGPDALSGPTNGEYDRGFYRAFFFSVQTFSTIGYGHISPAGLMPNIIVTAEALTGLLIFALATGLLFARFSRPTAKILFSRAAIIAPYQDITALEFRITNARRNDQIIELEAKVLFARFEQVNGDRTRRFYDLRLERDKVNFFPLSWTVVHPIDEQSPLYRLSVDDLRRSDAELIVLLTGIDETFSQIVHTRSSYKTDEIIWGAKFANIYNPMIDSEPLTIDVRRLDVVEIVETPTHTQG